jgi:hypothetical protein
MAVAHVRAYGRRDPRRFSRAGINRRLRAFAEGDERWSGARFVIKMHIMATARSS